MENIGMKTTLLVSCPQKEEKWFILKTKSPLTTKINVTFKFNMGFYANMKAHWFKSESHIHIRTHFQHKNVVHIVFLEMLTATLIC